MLNIYEMLRKYTIRHLDRMIALTSPLKSCLGIDYFHIHHVTNDGRMSCVCNDPTFNEFYFSMEESKKNPFMLSPEHLVEGVGLWEHVDAPGIKKSNDFFRNKMNIQQAICLVKFTDDGYYACGFGVPFSCNKGLFLSTKHQYLLHEYLSYFLEEGKKLMPDINHDFMDLHTFMGDNFHSPVKSLKKQQITDIEEFLCKIGKPVQQPYSLSEREKDCIALFMQGMTTPEVAKQLHLSPRTIENYFSNIKDKLGFRKKSEVIQYFHRLNAFGINS